MPVLSICDFPARQRRYDKWRYLAEAVGYIAVCQRGCHGHEAESYTDALDMLSMLESQCAQERHDSRYA